MKTALQKKTSALLSLLVMVFMVITSTTTAFAQDGENILINGDFANGNLNGWTTFVADFDGVNASFGVTNGEATVTNIVNAGNVVWHVQLNQFLTEAQIGALVEGASYAITFDARSSVNGRPVRVFFGEDGGEFRAITSRNFNLTTEMATYTVTSVLTAKFGAMKLGFEMGLSNADVIIDNISLNETEAVIGLDLPITFDDAEIDYQIVDFGGNASEIIVDPTDAENRVVRSIKTGSAELWAGTTVGEPAGFINAIPFAPGNTTMSVRVWSPLSDIPIRLKVEKAGDPTISVETEARTSVEGEWETLVFDFSNQATGTAAINFANTYNKASIFFNFGTTGGESGEQTYYWDDVLFGGESEVTAPPVPAGFVAFNTIGETPVGNGEVFLAAGPNSVEQANIVYRLFYALTSANLEDPKTGTEYVFGSTDGDGGGNAAFGFVLGGLEPGTEYTFWLYQYNIESELYSESAGTASVVSGSMSTNIGDDSVGIPLEYALSQNYPNPFNPTTSISFALPESGQVQLDIYNMLGQRVMTLVNGPMSLGNHTVTFDASSLSSGLFLYRLQAGNVVLSKKMTLLK